MYILTIVHIHSNNIFGFISAFFLPMPLSVQKHQTNKQLRRIGCSYQVGQLFYHITVLSMTKNRFLAYRRVVVIVNVVCTKHITTLTESHKVVSVHRATASQPNRNPFLCEMVWYWVRMSQHHVVVLYAIHSISIDLCAKRHEKAVSNKINNNNS